MKKVLSYTIFLFFSCIIPLYATTIDAQIEAIRHAPVKEKFKLMNAFKKSILAMKEKERMHAIRKLQKIAQKKSSNKILNTLKDSRQIHQKNDIKQDIATETENIIEDEIRNEAKLNE